MDDTIIFFLNDNGAPLEANAGDNGPQKGGKANVFEGGIHIPFMVEWKGHLTPGRVDRRPVISLDIFPTAVALAGAKIPAGKQIDGVNLLPYLTQKTEDLPHRVLFWRFGEQHAIHQGDWKLIEAGENITRLYDLKGDPAEKNNRAKDHPEMVKELHTELARWLSELMPERWKHRADFIFVDGGDIFKGPY